MNRYSIEVYFDWEEVVGMCRVSTWMAGALFDYIF